MLCPAGAALLPRVGLPPHEPPAAAGTAELPVNEAGKSRRSRRREARQNL